MKKGPPKCPVSGCMRVGCELVRLAEGCLGLLTLVLLFANSSLIVCGISGSKRTPCCRSCFAASAPARVLNVTKPTGEAVFPFLLVTFSKDPSYPSYALNRRYSSLGLASIGSPLTNSVRTSSSGVSWHRASCPDSDPPGFITSVLGRFPVSLPTRLRSLF